METTLHKLRSIRGSPNLSTEEKQLIDECIQELSNKRRIDRIKIIAYLAEKFYDLFSF